MKRIGRKAPGGCPGLPKKEKQIDSMIRIAIFVSGNGTNCENIIRHFHHHTRVKVALVLSNRADAYALVRAQNHHIPTVVVNKADFNREDLLLPLMRQHGIDSIGACSISIPLCCPSMAAEACMGIMCTRP